MILRYVLKSFRRRRVRTVLMVASLLISTALIVTMSATIETIRQSTVGLVTLEVGSHDITITRADTTPNQFIGVEAASKIVLSADANITGVYPRIEGQIDISPGGGLSAVSGWLYAVDSAEPTDMFVASEGLHDPGQMRASVFEPTAAELSVQIGDEVEISYGFPQPREKGSAGASGMSSRRAVGRFTISAIITRQSLEGEDPGHGIVISVQDAQETFGLTGMAERLIAYTEAALYESSNAEDNVLAIRDVAVNVQEALGSSYDVRAFRAQILDTIGPVFMMLQAGVNTYGLMSLAVVGLLVYTLVMTNVQEQRREMAVLRILGSQRRVLFGIVVVEVLVIGFIGVGLGIILGQTMTRFAVVPLIERIARNQGANIPLVPQVRFRAIVPAIVSSIAVLVVSSIRPARAASRTKVVHAINPGVADNLQIEDLEALRERRPNKRVLLVGIAVLVFALILNVQVIAEALGNPGAESLVFIATLILLAIGLVCVVFIFTRPFERLILWVSGLFAPRLTYFARRNVGRNADRNTLISLLILLSGVFPSYLATQSAMDNAQVETNTRLRLGAPFVLNLWSPYSDPASRERSWLRPSEVASEFESDEEIVHAVGLTHEYRAAVRDAVDLRSGSMRLVGVTGNLGNILYPDLVAFSAGGPEAFETLMADPSAVILSTGMADGLAVGLGDTVVAYGVGTDHTEELVVVGIADRLPGFRNVGRIRGRMMEQGQVLISTTGYQLVTADPRDGPPPDDPRLIRRVLAVTAPDADLETLASRVDVSLSDRFKLWIRLGPEEIRRAREQQAGMRIQLLALTGLSFVTAVFGVFAITYVTIYSRRREIGMLKAIGARRREMNGMLSLEAIAMTVGAALTGILAGASMSWLYTFVSNTVEERPNQFSVDTTVMPAIIIMVVTASILGTVLSARRIIRRKAVEILRMS